MPEIATKPVIAIIGGGFSGAAVAWNLARADKGDIARIVVFEPRARLGAGLAYDTLDPVHRINVPATRMSLDTSSPNAFADWLDSKDYVQDDPAALTPEGNVFPRRRAFGDYVWSCIEPYVGSGAIDHIRSRVAWLERAGRRWRITAENGTDVLADHVVIATSHPSPAAPRALAAMLEGHPRFIPDATVADALTPIRQTDSVLVVGNGLTSADVIAALLAGGHSGPITSISRRGLRSRGHAPVAQEPHGDFTSRPIRSARLLTRRIRETISQAALFGVSWHAVLDAVRVDGGQIWRNLPLTERRRLVRHLRVFWDVHRFRIAPQVESVIQAAAAKGQLTVLAASAGPVTYHGSQIRIALRLSRRLGTLVKDFDAVVVTTGPAHGSVIDSQPFLQRLAQDGLAALDPTGLGLSCDVQARLLDSTGLPVDGLYIAGPLARGTFGELMGLPQVADHAALVAAQILADLTSIRAESAA
jgi:uncharacterized NAD(P)/FAD-binding protein YdhS